MLWESAREKSLDNGLFLPESFIRSVPHIGGKKGGAHETQ